MNAFVTEMRSQFCEEREGQWLCRCGSVLTDNDGTVCAECAHRTIVAREKSEREEQRKAQIARAHALLERTLPPWTHAEPDSPAYKKSVDSRLFRATKTWDGKSLAVFGATGGGKSTYVIALLRSYLRPMIDAAKPTPRLVWTTGHQIALASRYAPLGQEPEVIQAAKGIDDVWVEGRGSQKRAVPSILVVDDVGFEPRSSALFEVVNARYESKAGPTIITSGLTPTEFADPSRYGAALYRRLVEDGLGSEINLHGS